MKTMFRQVNMIVLDLDPHVPAEGRIVFKTDDFWTEDSDEDLKFKFASAIQKQLETHNNLRKDMKWEDKNKDGIMIEKTGLKPLKFSDLKTDIFVKRSFLVNDV